MRGIMAACGHRLDEKCRLEDLVEPMLMLIARPDARHSPPLQLAGALGWLVHKYLDTVGPEL